MDPRAHADLHKYKESYSRSLLSMLRVCVCETKCNRIRNDQNRHGWEWNRKKNKSQQTCAHTHAHTHTRHQQYAIKQQIESNLKPARLLQCARALCACSTRIYMCVQNDHQQQHLESVFYFALNNLIDMHMRIVQCANVNSITSPGFWHNLSASYNQPVNQSMAVVVRYWLVYAF